MQDELDRQYHRGRRAAFEGDRRAWLGGIHAEAKYERWAYLAGYDDAMADPTDTNRGLDAMSDERPDLDKNGESWLKAGRFDHAVLQLAIEEPEGRVHADLNPFPRYGWRSLFRRTKRGRK